jgi:HAD superfamily hydrolase (TIGR01509 family)
MRAVIEERLGGPVPEEIDREFERLYRDILEAELTPVDGILDALEAITRRGMPTCVASSGIHAKIRRSLELTGLAGYFDDNRIFSATDVVNGKPAPDLFLHAAGRFEVSPGSCAVVEDSIHGVEAAVAAGMRAFAYAGGVTPAAKLSRPGVVVFDDMRRLPELLDAARAG